MLLITMLCYLFFYTGRHNFGWAVTGMAKDLDISYARIGWISFSMLIGYAVGQLVNGNLADRLSARFMVPTGAFLSITANVAISFCQSSSLILILWMLNGYFQSMAWAPGSKVIANWWAKEEHGKAFGFYTMAAGFSSVVTYLFSIVLLQMDLDWRMLFRLPIIPLAFVAIIFMIVIRDRPSKGLSKSSVEPENEHPDKKETWLGRYKTVLANPNFLMACLSFGFESMARYGLIFWVPVHYLGKGWKDNPHYLWATLLLPIGMAAGAISFGTLSDSVFKGNRIASIRMGMAVSAVLVLLVYISPASNLFLGGTLMFLSGFFVYGPQANFWPLSPQMLPGNATATGIGFMNMVGYLFAALGEPIFGWVIDLTGNTSSVFMLIGVMCLMSVIFISTVKKVGKAQHVLS
ncbi:MAG: MFS transporter [Flavobacteriales bacterium]|nr:MAG: MFS transporter [Flavobacteriales bacterium]